MIDRTDQGPVLGSGWIQGIATLIAIAGGIFLFATWKFPEYRQLAITVFAISLIPWAITFYRFYRLRKAIGKATLDLEFPIPLGFSGTATYSRPMRDAELRSIEASLQCEEEIVKGSGRNRRTIKKVVHREAIAPIVTPMMDRIDVRVPLRIPESGPASFSCEVAKTRWWLRFDLKMRGCPDTASSFEIEVAPGIASR